MDTRTHGVQGTGCHLCISSPTLSCISRDTAAHSNANAGAAAAAVILKCLGNKDEKSVYRLGIDILVLDSPDSWLQSWI